MRVAKQGSHPQYKTDPTLRIGRHSVDRVGVDSARDPVVTVGTLLVPRRLLTLHWFLVTVTRSTPTRSQSGNALMSVKPSKTQKDKSSV